MSASRFLLVARRELVENLRTKALWIGIATFPLILGAAIAVPTLLDQVKEARTYTVVDRSGWLQEAVEQRIAVGDLTRLLMAAEAGDPAARAALPASLRDATSDRAGDSASDGPRARAARALDPDARGREAVLAALAGIDRKTAASLGLSTGRFVLRPAEPGTDTADLARQVGEESLFAYIVVGADPVAGAEGFRYVSANLTDDDLRTYWATQANAVVRERRLERESIEAETAAFIEAPLPYETLQVGPGGEEAAVEDQDQLRQWAPVAFVYMLWISIFGIVQMLLTNTIEEKSNRLMEVLLSSISPLQLMAGKILGIALTGLTMVVSWLVLGIGLATILPLLLGVGSSGAGAAGAGASGAGASGVDFGSIASDPLYVGTFLVYFVLGYLFYAGLLVGIGAVCNSLKEAQNLQTPVTILLILPLFSMVPIARDPNGLLAVVLSYIPPFTPFVMMNRAAAPPTASEYAITTLIMLVSIAAVLWGAAKVFRVGVLMTGKPPRLGEILRWIRAPIGAIEGPADPEKVAQPSRKSGDIL